jgi:Thermostable hemolysin
LIIESFAMAALVVPEYHRLRAKAERFIREVYDEEYGARLDAFPPVLLVDVNSQCEILCAAGVRSCADGFFSERYLDDPIETTLARVCGRAVARQRIFETSTFASRSPRSVPNFVSQIIDYGEAGGFEWSFFTLTHRLSALLSRLGLELTPLGPADPARIENASAWGSYYQRKPQVYAVNRGSQTASLAERPWRTANA